MICNKCNAEIPDVAKFCPKCGNKTEVQHQSPVEPKPVSGPAPEAAQTASAAAEELARTHKEDLHIAEEPASNKSSGNNTIKIVWILIVVIALTVVAAGGVFLYNRYVAASPGKIQEKINAELKAKGLNITTVVDKDWQATLSGEAQNKTEKETALGIVTAHKEIKGIQDNTSVHSGTKEYAGQINSTLKREGINEISAEPDQDNGVVLKGTARNEMERENAVRIAKETVGPGSVKDEIQIKSPAPEQPRVHVEEHPQPPVAQTTRPKRPVDRHETAGRFRDEQPGRFDDGGMGPFRLESEINRALRSEGIRGVHARVNANMAVVLNGHVYGYEDKDRAVRIAESFREARRVVDRISVDR